MRLLILVMCVVMIPACATNMRQCLTRVGKNRACFRVGSGSGIVKGGRNSLEVKKKTYRYFLMASAVAIR